jgi:poly-gamma-glutamate synthesis protein (capsule biosynthesis protein)
MISVRFAAAECGPECASKPFPPQYTDSDIFVTAIAAADRLRVQGSRLSGITVPHHLLAADLIARTLRMVDRDSVRKIVVLFPDHFKRTRLPFATTRSDFQTVFGLVHGDVEDASRLLRLADLVEESSLFAREHGIGAIVPFISHYFPEVQVLPIAVSIRSHRADWDKLCAELISLIGPSTLIIQSTDFSHYLSLGEAVHRDQEVLNVLAAGDLIATAVLHQPQNTDSRGAQYIQLKLQNEFFHAEPVVLFNTNSQAYSDEPQERTTSYVVQLYAPAPATPKIGADQDGSKVFCFAGDTFFGRNVRRALADADAARRLQNLIKSVLNNCRLVLNLEGVMVPNLPRHPGPTTLVMPEKLTMGWLHALNVIGVGIANNHAMDLGKKAYIRMARRLHDSGFAVLRSGAVVDLGSIRIVALTDLDNSTGERSGIITDAAIDMLAKSGNRAPYVAFIHWGIERVAKPGNRQRALATSLAKAGVSLIVGGHPHVATRRLELVNGVAALSGYSLGNFIFDQSARYASGSVLEVRVFDQGTLAARLIPIPNFFDLARLPAVKD